MTAVTRLGLKGTGVRRAEIRVLFCSHAFLWLSCRVPQNALDSMQVFPARVLPPVCLVPPPRLAAASLPGPAQPLFSPQGWRGWGLGGKGLCRALGHQALVSTSSRPREPGFPFSAEAVAFRLGEQFWKVR